MEPMYLNSVEHNDEVRGSYADLIRTLRATGGPVSQIWHLFAYKPEATKHLEHFTQG